MASLSASGVGVGVGLYRLVTIMLLLQSLLLLPLPPQRRTAVPGAAAAAASFVVRTTTKTTLTTPLNPTMGTSRLAAHHPTSRWPGPVARSVGFGFGDDDVDDVDAGTGAGVVARRPSSSHASTRLNAFFSSSFGGSRDEKDDAAKGGEEDEDEDQHDDPSVVSKGDDGPAADTDDDEDTTAAVAGATDATTEEDEEGKKKKKKRAPAPPAAPTLFSSVEEEAVLEEDGADDDAASLVAAEVEVETSATAAEVDANGGIEPCEGGAALISSLDEGKGRTKSDDEGAKKAGSSGLLDRLPFIGGRRGETGSRAKGDASAGEEMVVEAVEGRDISSSELKGSSHQSPQQPKQAPLVGDGSSWGSPEEEATVESELEVTITKSEKPLVKRIFSRRRGGAARLVSGGAERMESAKESAKNATAILKEKIRREISTYRADAPSMKRIFERQLAGLSAESNSTFPAIITGGSSARMMSSSGSTASSTALEATNEGEGSGKASSTGGDRGRFRRFVSPRGLRGKLKYVTLLMVLLLAAPVPKRFTVTDSDGGGGGGGGGAAGGMYGRMREKYAIRDEDGSSGGRDSAGGTEASPWTDGEGSTEGPGQALGSQLATIIGERAEEGAASLAAVPSHQRNYISSFVADAVRKIGPSVIRIDTESYVDQQPTMGPFYRPHQPPRQQQPRPFDFFELEEEDDLSQRQIQQGQGSGIIFSSDGYVLTNAHVVDGASRVTVTLTDGRRYVAEVKGADDMVDLAVLKLVDPHAVAEEEAAAAADKDGGGVEGKMGKTEPPASDRQSSSSSAAASSTSPWDGRPLPVASFGNSDALQVGEWVIAVGNPVGLDNTVTMGIVSSIKRSSAEVGISNKKVSFIQTDAAINPGNSGGPLVNEHGEIIGINTCILANAEGIGFAIPINKAKSIMHQLAQGENVKHGYIGIVMTTVTPDFARQNNENPNSPAGIIPEVNGAMIMRVMPNTPASSCGLRRFDVVLEIGDTRVKNAADAQGIVDAATVGEDLELKILRGDREMTLVVKPGDLAERVREAKEAKQREQQQRFHQPGLFGPGPGGEGGGGKIYVFPFPSP